MEKLKGKFNFDLKIKYTYYSIFSNALFLNKKLYLLYNFWNKKKEFLLLDNQKKESRYDINYQGFFSLDFFFFNNIKFDYFYKWTSSYLNLNDLNLKFYFDNKNKTKYLVEPLLSNDYMIFDNIFFNYNINDKKKFFYLYKGKFLLNFFFKLSKKEKLELKIIDFLYLFNYYVLLNNNYYSLYFFYYWKKHLNIILYNKIFYYIKLNIKKYIKNFIFKFFIIKKMKNFNKILFFFYKKFKNKILHIFNYKYIYIFRNFLNNYDNKKKNLMFFNFFFQYKYFLKKFKKRYNKRFNKLFYECKIQKNLEKQRMLWLLKKKFLSIIGTNMFKSFKKKNFFSFLKFLNLKKKKIFFRNYYELNSLIYSNLFKKKKSSKVLKKKLKNIVF